MKVGTLAVSMTAYTADYVRKLHETIRENKAFAATVKNMKAVAKAGFAGMAAGLAMVGFAASRALAWIQSISGSLSDAYKRADDMGTAMARLGVSAKSLSVLEYMAKRSDVAIEQLLSGMDRLNRIAGMAAGGNAAAKSIIERMNVSAKDFAKMPIEKKLMVISRYLSSFDNTAQRAAAEFQILGRGAGNLGALLGSGTANMQALVDEAKDLGIIIGDNQVESLNRVNDAWDKMTAAAQQVANIVAMVIGPVLVDYMERVTAKLQWINKYSGWIAVTVQAGLYMVIDVLGKVINFVMLIGSVLAMIIAFLVFGLASLLSIATKMVTTIMKSITAAWQNVMNFMIESVRKLGLMIIKALEPKIGKSAAEALRTPFLQATNTARTAINNMANASNKFSDNLVSSTTEAASSAKDMLDYFIGIGSDWSKDLFDKGGWGKQWLDSIDWAGGADKFKKALGKDVAPEPGAMPKMDELGMPKDSGVGSVASNATQLAGVIDRIGTMSLRGLGMSGTGTTEEKQLDEQKKTNTILARIAGRGGVTVMG